MIRHIAPIPALLCILGTSPAAQAADSLSLPSSTTDQDLERLRGTDISDLHIIVGKHITTIAALQGLPLTSLVLQCTHVTDLSPLKGMSLRRLGLCSSRKVSDLAPLAGMPLESLSIHNTGASNLSPLSGCPLKGINLEGTPEMDIGPLTNCPLEEIYMEPDRLATRRGILRAISTLRSINSMPQQEFWSRYDRGEFSRETQPPRPAEPSSARASENR